MLRVFGEPLRSHICPSCALPTATQIRLASQLSSINKGLFREKIKGQKRPNRWDAGREDRFAPPRRSPSNSDNGSSVQSGPGSWRSRESKHQQEHAHSLKFPEKIKGQRRLHRWETGKTRSASLPWSPLDKNNASSAQSGTDSWRGRKLPSQPDSKLHQKHTRSLNKLIARTAGRVDERSNTQAEAKTKKRDPLEQLKEKLAELHLRIKQLGVWFEKEVPPILEPKEGFGDPLDLAGYRQSNETYWLRFFREKPGRTGAIISVYTKTIEEIHSILKSEPLSSCKDPWANRRKLTYLGRRSDEEMFPTPKTWVRRHINNAVQRSLARITHKESPWAKNTPLTIEEYTTIWDEKVVQYRKTGTPRDPILVLATSMQVERNPDLSTPASTNLGFLATAKHIAPTSGTLLRGRDWIKDPSAKQDSAFSPGELLATDTRFPLSTAASCWIYGHSAAMACLTSGRREIYRAYLSAQVVEDESNGSLRRLISRRGCKTIVVDTPEWKEAMDKASGGRPHQGILLEASPIPFPPVKGMFRLPRDFDGNRLKFEVEPQQKEELMINSRLADLKMPDLNGWRKPLVLLLDGVKDEGNMGNIIRTAYFFNVDAVAICVRTCAPISSHIVAKAASGALEAMPLFRLNKPTEFLRYSRLNGWKAWASVPPTDKPSARDRHRFKGLPALRTSSMESPLADSPAILMLGSEGEGLRDIMLGKADGLVSIDAPGGEARRTDLGIDSMNVASAAAVLLEAYMRKPRIASASSESSVGSTKIGETMMPGETDSPRQTSRETESMANQAL